MLNLEFKIKFNSAIKAVLKTELYQKVLRKAKKISPNAEVHQCFYYRKQYGIPGFRKYGRVHFICCVSLGITDPGYLLIKDNKVQVVGDEHTKELFKLCELIQNTRRISNSCMLGLKHEDDVVISDIPSVQMDFGFVIC